MEFNKKKHVRFIAFILLLGVIAMIPASLFDLEWTTYLHEHPYPSFVKFMSESIFELESFGGGDISFLYVLTVSLAYLLAWVPDAGGQSKKRLQPLVKLLEDRPVLKANLIAWRHFLGFHVIVGLFNTVFLVHTFKWVLGRARPYKVFSGELGFTDWFLLGPHYISEGWYHGSFPSGHASTVFVFIALAYVLVLNGKQPWVRRLGWLVGVFAFVSAFLMLLARAMTGAHWVSDSVFIIFASWATTHAFYYFGIHMPARSNYFDKTHRQLPVPVLYELVVSIFLFVVSLGFVLFFFGIRAWARGEMLFMVAAIPVGAWMFYWGIKKVRQMGCFNKRIFDEEVVSR